MFWPYLGSIVGALGQKQLPVVEMPLTTVKNRLRKNSVWAGATNVQPPLVFNGIQLVHAVIKSDFLNPANCLMPGIGFILQSHNIVDWSQSSFCLKPGGGLILSDFVQKSVSGRLGQALAILFAGERGFHFIGHLREILQTLKVQTKDANGHDLPIADFLCEDSNQSRCLVEAKGSFTSQTNCPKSTKAILKRAFTRQIDPWMMAFAPPATKSIAMVSYLRDHTNPVCDPSVLAFADPEESTPNGSIEIPSITLIRHNYAAWLSVMGFGKSASHLRSRVKGELKPVGFLVAQVSGLDIAFPWPWIEPWFSSHGNLHVVRWNRRLLIPGIELSALNAISQTLQGNDAELAKIKPLDKAIAKSDQAISETQDNYEFSIFPDRTFFGDFQWHELLHFVEIQL